jgi:hypothetical protein
VGAGERLGRDDAVVRTRGFAAVAAAGLLAAACGSSSPAGPVPSRSAPARPTSAAVMSAVPSTGANDPANRSYTQPEVAAAAAIPGVQHKLEPEHEHLPGVLRYDTSPPTGGNHSQYWADCTGSVYPQPIANENAVHALEHGAIWITYRPDLPADEVGALAAKVRGHDRMLMSPYPGLASAVSLQAWNYQLFVAAADDTRIDAFIAALHDNPQVIPEPGATCSQPTFLDHPSTFGHPLWVPAG